jgi:hypothetical protein
MMSAVMRFCRVGSELIRSRIVSSVSEGLMVMVEIVLVPLAIEVASANCSVTAAGMPTV